MAALHTSHDSGQASSTVSPFCPSPKCNHFFFLMNIWFLYLLTSWLNFFELFLLSISCLKLEPSLPLRWVVKFKGGLGKPCRGWFTSVQMMSQLKDWPCVHYAPAYLQIKYDGQNFFLFVLTAWLLVVACRLLLVVTHGLSSCGTWA